MQFIQQQKQAREPSPEPVDVELAGGNKAGLRNDSKLANKKSFEQLFDPAGGRPMDDEDKMLLAQVLSRHLQPSLHCSYFDDTLAVSCVALTVLFRHPCTLLCC